MNNIHIRMFVTGGPVAFDFDNGNVVYKKEIKRKEMLVQ